jgi:hypothetical protein
VKLRPAEELSLKYTWKESTSDNGKIAGWPGTTGPSKDALWSRQLRDSKLG